jgi:putative aldouronate transport system permease protein
MNDTGVKSTSDKIYQVIIILILCIFALAAILPFVLLLASSMTAEDVIIRDGYNFWPKDFSLYAYDYLFNTNAAKVFRAYGITFFVTVIGTSISLLIGPMLGWVLSRKDYKRGKVLTFLVFFTMLFNGGIVPSYIMWTQLFHVRNTIWALILPTLVFNGFFIILYKNNFASNIHPALIEAAKIDGAGELFIYFKIVMPLSLPILATIGLMVGLGYWNDWTNGLYYITDTEMYSLQQFLKSIMDNINTLASMAGVIDTSQYAQGMPGGSIRMAIAVIGVIPIMVLYPFFQKAFIAGIALGGVKE